MEFDAPQPFPCFPVRSTRAFVGCAVPATTTLRVDRSTHKELKRLARERRTSLADTVARAVRLLRQEAIGQDLAQPLEGAETDWLDAELG
jgi:hypothetical protein